MNKMIELTAMFFLLGTGLTSIIGLCIVLAFNFYAKDTKSAIPPKATVLIQVSKGDNRWIDVMELAPKTWSTTFGTFDSGAIDLRDTPYLRVQMLRK